MAGIADHILRRRVRRALKQLTRLQHDVFMLCRDDALDYAEIAGRLDITVRDVERHLADAITGLRRAMDRDPFARLEHLRDRARAITRQRG